MTKGISPVIASVILIALTLAIAGMFSVWATSFVQIRQSEFEEQFQCANTLEIDRKSPSLTYDYGNRTLRVIVINSGDKQLQNLQALITYPNEGVDTFQPDPAISLEPGKGKLVLVTENPEKPLRLRFFSDRCSMLGEVDVP